MTAPEMLKLLRQIRLLWPNWRVEPADLPDMARAWQGVLGELDFGASTAAVNRLAARGGYPPGPGDIVSEHLVAAGMAAPSMERAWSEAVHYQEDRSRADWNAGVLVLPDARHAATRAAMNSMVRFDPSHPDTRWAFKDAYAEAVRAWDANVRGRLTQGAVSGATMKPMALGDGT